MRVLFHADLSHGQAAAVWRCRHILEGMGIELQHIKDAFTVGPDEPVLVLVHSMIDKWPDFLDTCSNWPVVVLERIDGAQLSAPVRKHIGHPNLKAVIKNTIYHDWNFYNNTAWRAHQTACRQAKGDSWVPILPKPITVEDYKKLRLGFSFVAYPHYDALREIDPARWEHKTIDVFFAGTTYYGLEVPWLNWHRQQAVKEIEASGLKYVCAANRAYNFHEYYEVMRTSRFVVSPWGLGEPCYRDFEAILCGCMVIKPDTTYIKTVPGEFYRMPQFSRGVCRPDFSDLEEAIGRAQEISLADKATWAQWLLDQNSSEANAKRLAKIFREAVQ